MRWARSGQRKFLPMRILCRCCKRRAAACIFGGKSASASLCPAECAALPRGISAIFLRTVIFWSITSWAALADGSFFRIHKGILVNLAYLEGADAHSVRVGEERLALSRLRRPAFLRALAEYLGDRTGVRA